MSIRLSHSQINRFLNCEQSWVHHYRNGWRPIEIGSALVFGSAIGKAIEHILRDVPTQLVPNEYEAFDINWTYQEINGKKINLKDSNDVSYSKNDIDYDLLTSDEIVECSGNSQLACWYSLRHKGHLMIDTFKKDILPLITKIYSLEEKIELTNEEGDSSIGYSDLVCDMKGWNKPIILDFKTAAREYVEDSVRNSVQLSQYIHVLGEKYNTRLAGYCVFLKNIEKEKKKVCNECGHNSNSSHKTCNNEIYESIDGSVIILNETKVHKVRCNGEWTTTLNKRAAFQIIVDTIPEETEDFVVENIENICNSIKSGVFTKNVNSCFDNGWGRACEFQKLCWTGSNEGLVKIEPNNNLVERT